MSSLLSSHLEQISLCATSIADLPFPKPKIFTNALLSNHDITALIRDTEQHERALFHLAPPPLPPTTIVSDPLVSVQSNASTGTAARRATLYGSKQPKNKAVAAVLGGDLYQRTRRTDDKSKIKGDLDVEVLLEGAEKLAAVYPIAGAAEKIAQLRRRHQQLAANIAHYEAHVAQQAKELSLMNRPSSRGNSAEDDELTEDIVDVEASIPTREDLHREEEEVLELERKKRKLEDRVTDMERDLGGLLK